MLEAQPTTIYTDFSALSQLRRQASDDPQAALREVARQFESIFLNMVLKSMRDASFDDPLFDSYQSDMYQEMYDKQITLTMTEQNGIGLADTLIRQLERYIPQNQTDTPASPLQKTATKFNGIEDFVEKLSPLAEQAAEQLGVDKDVLLAQAALETGWGKFVSKLPNGQPSFNLFNIKADTAWDGNKFTRSTVEVIGGVARKQNATFRAYSSYEESFNDYVDFLKANPRYQHAINSTAEPHDFIEELQMAGYATDPHYAVKIKQIFDAIPDFNISRDSESGKLDEENSG